MSNSSSNPRNPNWSNIEAIIVWAFFVQNENKPLSEHSPEIKELSSLIKKLAQILNPECDNENLRNPSGVLRHFNACKEIKRGSPGKTIAEPMKKVWEIYKYQTDDLVKISGEIKITIHSQTGRSQTTVSK